MIERYCDRCGAAAQARYVFPNGHDLVFCGHHSREYEAKLPAEVIEDLQFQDEPALATV